MAIKVGGTTVIDDSRNVDNIGTIKGLTYPSSDGTAGQFLKTDGAGNLAFQTVQTDPTLGTLTKTFTNGESATITLTSSVTPAPVVSVTKEVAQTGQSSKGAWDVNATASNYDLHNTAYATTLTPSSVASTSVSDLSYNNNSFSTSGQGTDFQAGFFKSDGTKYYASTSNTSTIYEYDLSTAWDLTTASYNNNNKNYSGLMTNARGMFISPDGTKLFITGNAQVTYGYTLSTAWDISTAGHIGNLYNHYAQVNGSQGIFFKPDGTIMYLICYTNDAVYQYSLSTAWDLTTASYSNKTVSTGANTTPKDLQFSSDGTNLYTIDGAANTINHYTLSTAWDLATATNTGNTFNVSSQATGMQGLVIGDNDTKLYGVHNTTFRYEFANNDTLTLGTGSFASTDVGKRIQGNGGDVILTSTAGAYDTTGGSAFTDTSTIASGSWTMHGLKSAGADDGLTLTGYTAVGNISNATATGNSFSLTSGDACDDLTWKPDGTKFYTTGEGNANVYEYSCSTAWDITTATLNHTATLSGMFTVKGMFWKPDGLSFFVGCQPTGQSYPQYIKRYDLSTAWSISSINSSTSAVSQGRENYVQGLFMNTDGTKMFITGNSGSVYEFSMSGAYNPSTLSFTRSFATPQVNTPVSLFFNSDGTRMFSGSYGGSPKYIAEYNLTTGFDLSTASYSGNSFGVSITPTGMFFKPDLSVMFLADQAGSTVYDYSLEATTVSTSQYHLAVTNASGQIDSSYWTDINSMTADQSLGDGEAYYAVSTDDRTTWSVAKGSDGVRPIVRDNAGTWQYNTAAVTSGFGIADASYDSKSFSVASQGSAPRGMAFNNNGTKMYIADDSSDTIYEYVLSTANDISTASYNSVSLSIGSQDAATQGLTFNNDGTKMYMLGSGADSVFQYTLTTAFDLSTASYASKTIAVSTQDAVPRGLAFKPDGTKMYIVGGSNLSIFQYSLSTADDISTASYDSVSFAITGITSLSSMAFNNDGTKMFVYGYGGDELKQYSLSTAYDISTASDDSVSLSLVSQDGNIGSIEFSADGTKMFASGDATNTIYQYSTESVGYTTSTTWTDATTNDEFYALQQALGATSVNRMDKTQLDAVADGSHFTLGDTLDLMIALKQDTASASLPTSDGVTINYDAEALNQGAVLGTDYDFDFPANNKVRITSNAAQNLKIRVV